MNPRDLLTRLRDVFRAEPEALAAVSAAARVPSGLSRRQFLRAALIATTVAATVDVEQLLWMPGEKTIWLPHGLVDADWFTREALRILTNNLAFVNNVSYAYEVGSSLTGRVPQRYAIHAA